MYSWCVVNLTREEILVKVNAGESLQGAKLQQAELGGSHLYGAGLRGADLRWADLYRDNLRADLRKSGYDAETIRADGFDPEAGEAVYAEDNDWSKSCLKYSNWARTPSLRVFGRGLGASFHMHVVWRVGKVSRYCWPSRSVVCVRVTIVNTCAVRRMQVDLR